MLNSQLFYLKTHWGFQIYQSSVTNWQRLTI